jgi:hypothetical protein
LDISAKTEEKDDESEKWNKQQRENFERFGDIWYQEPYENCQTTDVTPPVANMPLQQHVQLSALQLSLLPTLTTAVAPSLPLILLIVITPPTCPATPEGQKHS